MIRPVSCLYAVLAVSVAVLLSGCGPESRFNKARQLEAKGYYVEAGMKYEEIVRAYPKSPAAPEALYRLGCIYQKQFKLYSQASHYFTTLVQTYPAAVPWVERAKLGAFNSPDYYPLTAGSFWIEGDSDTGGNNMRAEWNCHYVSTGTFMVKRRLFAGSRFVSEMKRFYRKKDFALYEYDKPESANPVTLLSYPYFEGKSWKSVSGGCAVTATVVSKTVSVRVKAGEFMNCLKVKEENPAFPGSYKYNYYAPGAGWVLTTIVGAGGREHRNTELVSYKIAPEE